ncbi:hypothetical protein [Sporosarcina sp. Te-1]|uniref:hypothetical protein n=1 Tax=Sporosarcina sp. Te-1 TaxID=2818390 RepID=UPI001A9FDC8C|nr:hypothetical protein [Sporosarcina sp. Te-1]QTD42490.1 hypothetical protein J3U78_06680 [Sporosarcina sp. Te-1]
MEQRATGQDGNRFIISERLTVELFLLVYVFVFFLGETTTGTPYIWLLLSIFAGLLSYFIFQKHDFSLITGILISLAVTLPLLFCKAPVLNVFLFSVYTLWRIKSNFSDSKLIGWPFLFVNTIVFGALYFLARVLFFSYVQPTELLEQLALLYLGTSFLYFFLRLMTIWITSKRMGNFQANEAGKVFAFIIGLGMIVYIGIYFGISHVRSGVFSLYNFLLGGLFKFFGIQAEQFMKSVEEGAGNEEEESGGGFDDFNIQEEVKIFGRANTDFEIFMLVAAIVLLLVAVVFIIRKKAQAHDKKEVLYTFRFRGRKDSNSQDNELLYDYSTANDEIRKTFERFETEAQKKGMSRLRGETISEWFNRMGWGSNEPLFNIYNNVRYGAQPPTETEFQLFLSEVKNIKEKYFKKDV